MRVIFSLHLVSLAQVIAGNVQGMYVQAQILMQETNR